MAQPWSAQQSVCIAHTVFFFFGDAARVIKKEIIIKKKEQQKKSYISHISRLYFTYYFTPARQGGTQGARVIKKEIIISKKEQQKKRVYISHIISHLLARAVLRVLELSACARIYAI
jgi:hypothetical protein